MNLQEQISRIQSMMGLLVEDSESKIKRLILNYPNGGIESFAAKFVKLAGLVTDVFSSVGESIDYVENNTDKFATPLDEFIIGSHGNKCSTHIMRTEKEKGGVDEKNLLLKMKQLNHIGPNTKVFFTACYGADELDKLISASEHLGGHKVYGAQGVYNYVTNDADGFFWCRAPKENEDIGSPKFIDWAKELQRKTGKSIKGDSSTYNQYYLDSGICGRANGSPIKGFL